MPLWLMLIAVGVVLALVGAGSVGNVLVWAGAAVLVAGLLGILLNRGRPRV